MGHIRGMNIFKKFSPTAGKPAERAASAPANPVEASIDPTQDVDVKGLDARRTAELKAETAGAKWRAEAEAKGEIEKEIGGPKGLEPTRYGDWEKAGRCYDF